ncbi:hypothetical protein [Aeromonas caviae]|uniref:hypothetical protein n=1 Tax=Aeromonas caviae TaxID=648 RepID=UPI001CC709AE|nr:hypothetical protein [Aeromonas caviae]GJB04322.1 hypothetical protein KAM360_32650 [Aeromonas caviae]GKR44774.1 hypothetical protein KAM473_22930 [Aeromonas caviae]GKR52888.1 hypothetical protein KAM475_20350 [Aeromonas caviae]GKR63537.1 hypothetical protein KAM477_41590 [Aeromonas caviae]GKR87583.1 hypothetical protein KAM483_24840 [Aeromonas caviae]
MAWNKGQTGNANGRPAGSGKAQMVRRIIADVFGDESGAIRKVAELAQEGDLQACSLLLSKTVPPLRSSHEAVTLIDAETLQGMSASQRAGLINEASITGRLPADIALLLLDGIEREYRILECTELSARFEALEKKLNQRGKA